MTDAAVPSPAEPTWTRSRAWRFRVARFSSGVAIAWLAHWLKYSLPQRSPAAVVGAVFVVLMVLEAKKGLPLRRNAFLLGALALGAAVCVRPWCDPGFAAGRLWCRFDAEAWRDVEANRSDARLWMIDDYLAEHSPVGRPVTEIDALLGKDELQGGEHIGSREWWLGAERGMIRIDSETLVLDVDGAGTVTKAWIYHD